MREETGCRQCAGTWETACLEVSKARAAISFQFNPELSKRK